MAKQNNQNRSGSNSHGNKSCQESNRAKNFNARNRGENRHPKRRDEYADINLNGTRDGVPSSANDEAFYLTYPDLTYNAGKIAMLYPAGRAIEFPKTTIPHLGGDYLFSPSWSTVPGVMEIQFVPCYGMSDSVESPLTLMSRTLYNNLVAATNRVPSYDYTDLTMYHLGINNFIAFYYATIRAYLTIGTYDQKNLYWNQSFANAMQIDFNDWRSKRSQIFSDILIWAKQLETFPFPKGFNLFDKTLQMCSNIYKDGDGPKSQMYVFRPVGFYEYVEPTTGGGASLQLTTPYTQGYLCGWNDWRKYGNQLLTALTSSSDIQMMVSDILKVYGTDLQSVAVPVENGIIEARREDSILNQLMNADIWHGYIASSFTITQSADSDLNPYLVARPKVTGNLENQFIATRPHILNFIVDNPSEVTVVDTTRYCNVATVTPAASASDDPVVNITSCGTELLVGVRMMVLNANGTVLVYSATGGAVDLTSTVNYQILCGWCKFDWAPRLSVYTVDRSGSPVRVQYRGDLNDLSNYTYVSDAQVERMNYAALANLLKAFG